MLELRFDNVSTEYEKYTVKPSASDFFEFLCFYMTVGENHKKDTARWAED